MNEQQEWMSASEAVGFLEKSMHPIEARQAICRRAHAGLVRARTIRFLRDGIALADTNVPTEFWWAHGKAALTQNWKTGDFETWIKQRVRLQAFGVEFSRADIERMSPQHAGNHDLQLNAKLSGKDASVGRDGFLDLFWNLDQIVAWARTRDPEAVRYAEFAPSCGKRHNTLEIDLFCNFATAEAKAAGGDIKEALWRASGWQKPNLLKERSVEILSPGVDVPLPFDAEREALMAQLEAEGKIRIIQGNHFPALDYLLHLFRLGRLVATGNVVGDPKAQEISTKDWAGLEVAEGGDDERLAVWRIGKVKTTGGGDFENVRVSRDNVLREFPSDLGELTTLELEAEPTRRKPTTQEDREADQRSAEQSRAMAARDFAEVFWPLEYALKWVALQRPERMHESLRAAILYNGGQPLAEGDFKGAILRALQEGRLHGVRDSKPLAPEFWAGVQPYALPAKVYLRREEMLALWPALAAANPSDDDARALIRAAVAERGGFIGQDEGAEIVRQRYPEFPKKRAMALVKELTGNEKPGPKGPRKNRAANRA